MSGLRRHWPELALWLLVAGALVWLSWERVVTRGGWDPDDQLRLVQLRDFLGGQSWFDNSQYRLNPPDGAPMHWSRLIELPLAFFVVLLSPLIGTARAEMVAGVAIPMLCLGGIAFLLSRMAEKIGGRAAGISAFLLTLMAPALLIQLRPMRIDHHGWQIFCAVLALATLFWTDRCKAGLVMGAALAAWTHISLEGAPMTAAFFLLLGWRWVMDREEAKRLFWTLCAFGGLSLTLFLGTQAGGFSARQYCDTVSPAHIWAIVAALGVLLPAVHWNPVSRSVRLAAAMLAGMAAVSVLLWLAPACAQGAFADLDPVVREYWYAKISEGLPFWYQDRGTAITLLTPLAVALVALVAAFRFTHEAHRPMLRQLGFFLIYASLLSLLVFRSVAVATAFTIVPTALCLGAAFNRYRIEPLLVRRLLLVCSALLLLTSGMVAGAVVGSFEPKSEKAEVKREVESEQCEGVASARTLRALPKGNIIAPFDMGPAILLTTRHSVLASSHHRNARGMRDQIDIFRLPPEQARVILSRHGIDYIIACPGEAELDIYAQKNPDGLWAQLANGNALEWLEYRGRLRKGAQLWAVR